MKSALRRSTNSTELAMTNTPINISLMHKICLTSKKHGMRNMPTPRCYYECNLTLVKLEDAIRNALIIRKCASMFLVFGFTVIMGHQVD